jgi:hypothetical protein
MEEKNPQMKVHGKWHTLLQEILDGGIPDAIEAVQRNLLVFSGYTRLKKKKVLKPSVVQDHY